MTMIRHIRPALVLFALLSTLTGLAYPLGLTAVANLLFSHQAQGSIIIRDGHPVGSALIGQNFTSDRYFHPRPSATSGVDPADPSKSVPTPYNAAASVGSNLGPTSRSLVARVSAGAAAIGADNPDAIREGWKIPADLVTTSASGLDPDISPEAAFFQARRVALARHLPEMRVRGLVVQMIRQPMMGWLGEPHVNVLALNLALDAGQ